MATSQDEQERKKLNDFLNKKLFSWPSHSGDSFTINDATEGIMIFGATGSGKSSGSGAHIAKAYLKNGFGGVVLCAKPGERAVFEKYVKATDRENVLEIFELGKGQFNPLYFEQNRQGKGKDDTFNMVNMLMALNELGRGFMSGGSGGGENEKFWDQELRKAIRQMIDALKLSGENLSMSNMREIMSDALDAEEGNDYLQRYLTISNPEIGNDEKEILITSLTDWSKRNYLIKCLVKIDAREDLSEKEGRTKKRVKSYFLKELARLSERTKSIVVASFFGLIDPFSGGILEDQFTGIVSPNLWPELTYEQGKIIILDFSLKEYLISGLYAQAIYKYCFMQEMERRVVNSNEMRPVFLWIDEMQNFIQPEDSLFQTTARSSLTCTVMLSQNLNNLIFAMGKDNAQSRAKSLLGNLNTKIWHSNGDYDTNQYAADTIGKVFKTMTGIQSKLSEVGTASISEQLHYQVFPHRFTTLKRGGRKENGYKTEAIIFRSGDKWSNGKNYLKVTFDQQ